MICNQTILMILNIEMIDKLIFISATQSSNLNMEAEKRPFHVLLISVFVCIQYIDLKYSWKMVGCVVEWLEACDAHQESMFDIWNLIQNIIWCLQSIFLQKHIFPAIIPINIGRLSIFTRQNEILTQLRGICASFFLQVFFYCLK